MIIPYGTCVEPFYIHGRDAWNYGGLGAIIGHEMCHGFDEEGKEFNEHGQKKRWWTNSDNRSFSRKTKELVALFKKQIVEGGHVDGNKTLSENIADLGGLAISLQALQDSLKERGVVDEEDVKKEYREFFISFATSWRTKYRPKKLKSSLGEDPHAPAFLRVNLIVSQFEEWYTAFDVKKGDKLYIEPEDRIRIF
jgi:predicted metalloendopeptidase